MDRKIKAKQGEEEASRAEKELVSNRINSLNSKHDNIVLNTIPKLEQGIVTAKQIIDETYSIDFQNETGIPRYETELSECGSADAVAKKFELPKERTKTGLDKKERMLVDMRSEYNKAEQTSFKVTDVSDNNEYEEEYQKIKDYELPLYREKIERAKNEAMDQFKSDFLYKLRNNIENAELKIREEMILTNSGLLLILHMLNIML